MDLLDIIIIVLFVLSLVRGVRLGAAMQVLSFGGFWAGLIIGALIAPNVAGLFSNPFSRLVAVLVVVFGCAGLVGTVGRQLGMRVYGFIRRVHLGPADAAIGAVVAGAATLLVAWAVAGMVKDVPAPQLVRQISGSTVLRRLNDALPPSPQFFSRIEQLLNTHGFPQVFAGLAPTSAGPVQAAGPASVQEAVANAGHSTVKIVSQGCGEILEGSGFLVAPGLYVTNAHVVAGTYSTQLEFQNDVPVKARVVYFDPNFDLALLRAPELPGLGAPLTLDNSDVNRGQLAAVLGYPGGGNFNAQPAGVRQLFLAQGRNIYGTGLTNRFVYELQAIVRPGNSGGP
ncbi:MAG TPA: MarP family serine protease, partial [Acidimicrobiales bacterium]|nr:MarP family serine protease [Acidimicrobiales bacterium]